MKKLTIFFVACILAITGSVMADEGENLQSSASNSSSSATSQSNAGLEEIVVTARKREERTKTIPRRTVCSSGVKSKVF